MQTKLDDIKDLHLCRDLVSVCFSCAMAVGLASNIALVPNLEKWTCRVENSAPPSAQIIVHETQNAQDVLLHIIDCSVIT